MSRSSLEALTNTGFVSINENLPLPGQATVVVLGYGRGGTSMVAAALQKLGIFMGPNLGAVYEDVQLAQPMESGKLADLRRVIAQRNESHAWWGFKRPAAINYFANYEREFRNPRLVVVFRDLVAIANRDKLSNDGDLLKTMRAAHEGYLKLLGIVERTTLPVLLVSYEKALSRPGVFAATLAAFCGIESDSAVRRAREAVKPENSEYLEQARLRRGRGAIENVTPRRIRGWACLQDVETPATVSLRVNGTKLCKIPADQMRPDLVKLGIHPTGRCGFLVELPEDRALKPGDKIHVRIVGEPKELRQSPLTVPG